MQPIDYDSARSSMTSLRLYGSYDRAPFDPLRSPVMIWELSREGEPAEGMRLESPAGWL